MTAGLCFAALAMAALVGDAAGSGEVAQLPAGEVAQLPAGEVARLPAGEVAQLSAGEVARLPAVAAVPPDLDSRWREAGGLEDAGHFRQAGQVYERMLAEQPGRSDLAWRAARSFWQFGELQALEAFEKGEKWYERADVLAGKGLEANPNCGECALWKYAAMGRLVDHRGTLWAVRHASDLGDLLELGIAAQPTHTDPNGNSALANLYYSSAIFYRLVPEWFWLPYVVGVKGDTAKALVDIRHALAISADRLDYQIELGAVLLCRSLREQDEASATAGARVLDQAIAATASESSDVIDQHYAKLMLADPSVSCSFTRGGFLNVAAMASEAGLGFGSPSESSSAQSASVLPRDSR